MNFSFIIIFAAIFTTIGNYIDKGIVDKGISRKNYFYYMCLTMIPFALITMLLEIKTGNFKFSFNLVPIILLIIASILRYLKQKSNVVCLRNLEPYELKTYMSITLIICFIIDVIFKIQEFTILKILSIIFIIIGVILIYNVKISFKKFKKDLFIKIITEVIITYIVYNVLKYWSNGMYMLLLNLLLVIVFTPCYKTYKKENKVSNKLLGLIYLQQVFGFTYTYINNYLTSNSATLSNFVSPISLVFTAIVAFFINKNRKPTFINIIGIIMVAIGICFMNIF